MKEVMDTVGTWQIKFLVDTTVNRFGKLAMDWNPAIGLGLREYVL